MGNCGSNNKKATEAVLQQKPPDPDEEKSDDDMMDGLAESFHDPQKSARQKMAWHREDMHIEKVYDVVKLIGQGSMGEVLSVRKKPSNTSSSSGLGTKSSLARSERLYAAKTINTTRFKKSEVKEFINEIDILRDLGEFLRVPLHLPFHMGLAMLSMHCPLCFGPQASQITVCSFAFFNRASDHPNIIHMYEIFSTKRKIWIVTELCTGGDLGERARSTQKGMTEYEVADVTEQILRALCYMHKRGVCHRDLKFEVRMLCIYLGTHFVPSKMRHISNRRKLHFLFPEYYVRGCQLWVASQTY
jgi:serine/threonine protein kinase